MGGVDDQGQAEQPPLGASLSPADLRLQSLLADGTIRLLSCKWLRSRVSYFILPRHQEMPSAALLSPEAATRAFGASDRRVGALSYGWLTRYHPDPRGERATHVLSFLRSPAGLRFEALFWDFGSLPEPDEAGYISETDLAQQRKALSMMNAMYASARGTAVIRLAVMPSARASGSYNVRPIDERGWCVFEMYVAMIVVGHEAQDRGCHLPPKLLDATGGEVPELVAAPTPEEFAARVDSATFTVASDVNRAKRYYLEYYLENGVSEATAEALARVCLVRMDSRRTTSLAAKLARNVMRVSVRLSTAGGGGA